MPPLTSVKGWYYLKKELLRYSEEKLLEELQVQKVVKVNRFRKKENGVLNPTPSLLLIFDCFELPTSIKVAWISLKVKPYIPNPRRVFHCQMHDHVSCTCRKLQQGIPAVCVNCVPTQEREILHIHTRDKVHFAEARSTARKSVPNHGDLYAQVLSQHKAQQFFFCDIVHMDEASTSATPHLSSTCHPGTQKISAKRYQGSAKSLDMDKSPVKVSMMESSDCCEGSETPLPTSEPNSKSQTLQQMSAQAGASSPEMPTDLLIFFRMPPVTRSQLKLDWQLGPLAQGSPQLIFHLGSHLQGLTLVWEHWMGLCLEEFQLLHSKFSPICICLQEIMLSAYDHPPPKGYLAFYSLQNSAQTHHGGTAILVLDKCGVPIIHPFPISSDNLQDSYPTYFYPMLHLPPSQYTNCQGGFDFINSSTSFSLSYPGGKNPLSQVLKHVQQIADKFSFNPSPVLTANDSSSVATPQEIAELFATAFSGFMRVCGVEESQVLDFGMRSGETCNIMFSMKEMRTALSLTGDTSPGT
ncbi:hypothetical protein Hamer_G000066, partial [Homarus americanus]